jgi:hypothetical protein
MTHPAALRAAALIGLAVLAGLFCALTLSAQAADCALAHLGQHA